MTTVTSFLLTTTSPRVLLHFKQSIEFIFYQVIANTIVFHIILQHRRRGNRLCLRACAGLLPELNVAG